MNSFTFYNNYYELLDNLPREDKLIMLEAIVDYMFKGIEPDLNGLNKAIWINIKMPLDTSKNNAVNGFKGGCPKGTKKPSMVGNKNASKDNKTKPKQNRNKTENKSETKTNNISYFYFLISNFYFNNNINNLLNEYLELRIKNKYSISETIVKRLCNKLNEYGNTDEEKEEIIINAINGAWKDFYPLKEKKEPRWFNKTIKQETATKEEQDEMNEILKEFK